MVNARMNNLPKWAQQHIADCERRCNEAENRLRDYLDSQTPSALYVPSGIREKSYIQNDRVRFKLKRGEITVAINTDGNFLECHASYSSARLIVVPRVSNVVCLEIQDDK